jgi:hypothetical protein
MVRRRPLVKIASTGNAQVRCYQTAEERPLGVVGDSVIIWIMITSESCGNVRSCTIVYRGFRESQDYHDILYEGLNNSWL